MNKQNLKIGILDDDSSKITALKIRLKQGFKFATDEKKAKYSNFVFEPIVLNIQKNIENMVQEVISQNIECVLVDYNLSSFNSPNYNGVNFAEELDSTLYGFPIFIITSYEDDLFNHEIFNSYQVFNFGRYIGEDSETTELNFKIIEQILKRNKQILAWEQELIKLLPDAGTTNEIDSRLLELDTMLEKSIDGRNSISIKQKREFSSNNLVELLEKIEFLLEKE